MRRGLFGVLAVSVLAVTLTIGFVVGEASLGFFAGRYPGAERVTNEALDLAYLRRGWLSRRSVFQTAAELGVVERWYQARYGPVSEAEAHTGAACAGFRKSRLLVRLVYAVAVTLCPAPSGTRITVDESVFYSPPAPPARAP